MKKYSIIIILLFLISCSTTKKLATTDDKVVVERLSVEEINVVNDFLDTELASDVYKNYKNLEVCLIENAGNGIENITVYEYDFKDWHSYVLDATPEDNERLGWILDTIQIKDLKSRYVSIKEYSWKSSDIKNFKVSIMKQEAFENILRSGEYAYLPERLILRISKPLIIDEKQAFITFRSGGSRLGFSTINNYTALMKKVNNKWIIGPTYWDGEFE
jgi:hypothetical protein